MKGFFNFRLFQGKISFLLEKRSLLVTLILLAAALLVFLLSVGLGDYPVSPFTVLSVIFGGGNKMEQLVVLDFRLPRILIALLVGIGLAVSGAILQGIIRNPLASPDIIGVTGGASVAVVAFLAIFTNDNNVLTVSISWMPLAAFIGACIVAFLGYFLAWKNGVSPIRLVLIGIGISMLMQALTTLFMILGPIYQASQANIWITGTVHGSKWSDVTMLAPWTIILLILSLAASRTLNLQELGDDLAIAAGGRVQKQRFILLIISTALVGGAVAFAGGIGFVGLMAPHMARRLVGSSFGALIPVSAILGAILVMVADLIGRTLFSPLEIPAGVFTAGIGAPYFIYLLYKTRNR
ncbi:MAG TPA: iron ABC transporter permease [Bacillus sp. (in: firmicutes)]|uniref:FecCD family ABC transporter permease n=1 Tax=Bacillus litorisediminis TaxID=2922713 RepID=UPI001FB03911|nr:iron ABC transporter permease [Bacillus litorisediminis]HWO77127.1 iron ABC transporter permease [Bacillus sp. (in: firmicutes)]